MLGFHKRHGRHGDHLRQHFMRGGRGGFFGGFGEGFDDEGASRGGFGHRGGRGGARGGGRRRMFESSELRLVLLKLIAEQPRHGYDLIRAVEELSGGAYAPSPGVVYPTLTMLQDMGHIAEQASEGAKRLFAITDAGVTEIEANEQQIVGLVARLQALGEEREGNDRSPVRRAMMNLGLALRSRMTQGERDGLAHDIAAILDEAAQRIERL